MRVSSYVLGAPLSDSSGFVLMHGYSGALDKVSSELGRALVGGRGREFGGDCWPGDVIERLRLRGYLTDLTADEERDCLVRLTTELHSLDLARRPSLFVIVPTYVCNLRCPYCFQEHSMHAGEGHFSQLLSPARVEQIFRAIDRFRAAGSIPASLGVLPEAKGCDDPAHQPDVTLFGGEPLLEVTLPVVSQIVARCRERGIGVGAVTNAVELQHFESLLGPSGISELQITIDGPPETHDRRRVGPRYKQTFALIADNVQRALDRGAKVGIRINVDAANSSGLDRLEAYFAERGWSEHPGFIARAAEVHPGWAPNPQRKLISGSQLVQLTSKKKPPERPEQSIESHEDTARKILIRCLTEEGFPFHKTTFCGAEAGMMIFDPQGDVYACWEQVGHPNLRIARYGESGVEFDEAVARSWLNRHPGAIEDCSRCPYALIHNSGCAHQAWKTSGSLFAPACESFQEYFPATLARAYEALEKQLLSSRPLSSSQ